MATSKHTYWGYTLNNYTAAELVLIRNPPDWVREHVYTLEQGEAGTPHVQGFFRLKSDQRMSYITKRWLPRANLRFLDDLEYRENMRAYVQKQDETAVSATHQVRNTEPVLYPALIPELLVREVMEWGLPEYRGYEDYFYLWDASDEMIQLVHRCFRAVCDEKGLRYVQDWFPCDRRPASRLSDLSTEPIPWELALEAAKHTLVRRHRVETLVNRPEVNSALRSFRLQILERIKQNAHQTHDEEASVIQEASLPQSETSSLP